MDLVSIVDCGFPVFNSWFSVFVKNTHVFSDVLFDAIFSFFLIGFLRADISTRYKTFTENLLFPIRGFVALKSAMSYFTILI